MRSHHPTKKAAPAQSPHPARACVAEAATPSPGFRPPHFIIPAVMVPGAHSGEYLLTAGKPKAVPSEINTAQFARESHLSRDYVARMCSLGLLKARRKSPRGKSFWLIDRRELDRIRSKEGLE